jgi:DNA-binding IclR family transcriptional regulator
MSALARGLDVLRCFGPRDRWLATQDIVRRTGLAKPTVSRVVYTLTQLGHLRYSSALRKYALGNAALSLGYAALAQNDIRRISRPAMQALSEQTSAAVHLSIRDRHSMIIIDTYRNSASFVVELGSRVPIATTSIGRAFVCTLPPAQREELLGELRAARPEEWPQTRKKFELAQREFEEHGYCLGIGDWRRDVNGIAVPLLIDDGVSDPVVFSCSGAAFQLTPEVLRRDIGPRLLTIVGNVRSALPTD